MRTVTRGLAHAPASTRPRPAPQPTLEALGFEAVADELRAELRALLAETPAWRRARLAFVVREDGVEVLERAELAQHYRRHGLASLARQVRAAPLGSACVVLEGEPETAVLAVDAAWWLTTGSAVAQGDAGSPGGGRPALLAGFDSSPPDQGGAR